MGKFEIVTLCGSTRFKDKFHEVAERLTLEGYIVLMPHCYSNHDNKIVNDIIKKMLIDMHRQMIDISDRIFVIDVDGYTGDDTKGEIQYAYNLNKLIDYYSKYKFTEEGE